MYEMLAVACACGCDNQDLSLSIFITTQKHGKPNTYIYIYSNLFYLKCTQTMQCTGKHVRVVILILSLCKFNVSNVFLISVIFLSCLGTNTLFPIVSLV